MNRRFFLRSSAALAGAGLLIPRTGFASTGSAPNYTGYASNGSFYAGGEGQHVGPANWRVVDQEISNMQGACIDFTGSSAWQSVGIARGNYLHDSYKGIWTHGSAEGMDADENYISNCVFGAHIDSGNNTIRGGQIVYCSVGIKVGDDPIGSNNAHGIVSGVVVRHCTYLVVCQNVTLGHLFEGCQFVAGQAGSDQGVIQIINSTGLQFNGCGLAYCDISVTGPMPSFKDCTVRGPVTLNGVPFSGNN